MSQTVPEPSAETLRVLLRHLAWTPRDASGAPYELWHPVGRDGDEDQLLVPTDPERGDFDALVRRATQSILRRYGVVADRFVREVEMRQAGVLDSTRWQKETAVPPGLILWDEGHELYDSAQLQLIAAAKTSREPRPYHGNASSWVAKRFLEQSFMGQTDVGSFIITALTPAQARFHLSQHSEEVALTKPRDSQTVTGRSILTTFEHALGAMRAGLDEYARTPRVDVFLEKVEDGVSYEMAKALGVFVSRAESAIQIDLEGSAGAKSSRVEYTFKPPEASVLATVSTELAQDPHPRNVTLQGEVTLLSRDRDQSQRVIRLSLGPGAPARKARVRLTHDQYELALEAHAAERPLSVSGSLQREGRVYWLYDASDVRVVRDQRFSGTRVSTLDEAFDWDDSLPDDDEDED